MNKTTAKVVDGLDIVAIADIAERLGLSRVTVEKWGQRRDSYADSTDPAWAFPAPRWTVANGRTSLWLWDDDIVPWLRHTDRYRYYEEEQATA